MVHTVTIHTHYTHTLYTHYIHYTHTLHITYIHTIHTIHYTLHAHTPYKNTLRGGKRKITDAPTDTAKRPRTSRSPSPAVFAAAAAGSGNSSAAGGGLHSRMEAAVRSLVGSAPPHSVTMKDVTAMMKTKFVV